MPKAKRSRQIILNSWISAVNDFSFTSDGLNIYCEACQKQICCERKSQLTQHANTSVHRMNLTEINKDRRDALIRDKAKEIHGYRLNMEESIRHFPSVKTIGPEKAAKCRPSPLSVEVWKLMENARKNDGDADHLDDNGQESTESSTSLQTILDKLTSPAEEVTTVNEIKLEVDSDEYNSEEEASQCELSKRKSNMQKKRRYNFHDEPMNLAEPRTNSTVDIVNHPAVDSSLLSNTREKISSEQEDSTQRSIWMFDVAQREHDLKMRVLNIELERAELQKQTAVNELKTSELKRQLIESQAAEYCSQVRMTGERGSGAGKGGGGGGSIRDAGGSFGKMEAAHEDQYFYNLQKRQIQKLKDDLHDEISFHEEQIKRHQEAINRHKKRITDMSKE